MKARKADDHYSDASESTASGGPTEPPMTPEVSKLIRGALTKPHDLLLSASTNSGFLSPTCLTYDNESVSSPNPWISLNAMLDAEAAKETPSLGAISPSGPPPAPKYPAPDVRTAAGENGLPPAPVQPPFGAQAAQLAVRGPPSLPPSLPNLPSSANLHPSSGNFLTFSLASATLHGGSLSPSHVGPLSPTSPSAPPWLPEPPHAPPTLPSPSHHVGSPTHWAPPTAAPNVWPWSTTPGMPAGALQQLPVPDASQRSLLTRPMLGTIGHGMSYPPMYDPAGHMPRFPMGVHHSPILAVAAPQSPQGQHLQPMPPPPQAPQHPPLQPYYPPPSFAHYAPEAPPPMQPATGTWPGHKVNDGEIIDTEVQHILAMLSSMRSPSSAPPLPPSGCYGSLHISSALCDGLGSEAAEAAAAAAKELGERPVKVLLPWYPTHPGIAMFDQTKPAKVPIQSR